MAPLLRAALAAALLLTTGCSRMPTPPVPGAASDSAPNASRIASVACGASDHAGAVPRGHTVHADRRVARWAGRGASGDVVMGQADAEAHERLWQAARGFDGQQGGGAMEPVVFVEVATETQTRRYERRAAEQTDAAFEALYAACQEAVGSAM